MLLLPRAQVRSLVGDLRSCMPLSVAKKEKGLIKFFCFLFFLNKFIYFILFLAALGLGSRAWAFSSCGKRGLLFVAVSGLLITVASLVAEHML